MSCEHDWEASFAEVDSLGGNIVHAIITIRCTLCDGEAHTDYSWEVPHDVEVTA